jgi:hypothetical protein
VDLADEPGDGNRTEQVTRGDQFSQHWLFLLMPSRIDQKRRFCRTYLEVMWSAIILALFW